MKKKAFPKMMAIYWEEDAGNEKGGFWIAYEHAIDLAEVGESKRVGFYTFKDAVLIEGKADIKRTK